jgi:hypothetical protein
MEVGWAGGRSPANVRFPPIAVIRLSGLAGDTAQSEALSSGRQLLSVARVMIVAAARKVASGEWHHLELITYLTSAQAERGPGGARSQHLQWEQ